MTIENDKQFADSVLTGVVEYEDSYQLGFDGCVIGCPKVEGLQAPRVGEIVRLYSRGPGYRVRGITVEGRVYRYRTAAQDEEDHAAECRSAETKREQELEANLLETNRRIAALPALFQERIEKFRRDGGRTFMRDYEGYELFCCEQAVLIADALGTVEAIIAFHEADEDEQKRLVPALGGDHSGHTFGTACALARIYLERPELVTKMHGSLTPLVGCEAFGCKHPVENA